MLRLYVGHRIQRLYLFPSISLYGLGYIAGGSAKNVKGSEALKGRAGGTESRLGTREYFLPSLYLFQSISYKYGLGSIAGASAKNVKGNCQDREDRRLGTREYFLPSLCQLHLCP